jgi:hypothetical protein
MQNKIDPGYGYRSLVEFEEILTSDEAWSKQNGIFGWHQCIYATPRIGASGSGFRRRIELPEGYELIPESEGWDSDAKVFNERDGEWRFVLNESRYGYDVGGTIKDFPHLRAFARKIKEQPKPAPKIEAGYGYRLLGDDEACVKGDDYGNVDDGVFVGYWTPVEGLAGRTRKSWGDDITFRRKIYVGDGYRLLAESETIERGDEMNARSNGDSDGWIKTSLAGRIAGYEPSLWFRRKIETTPLRIYGDYIVVMRMGNEYRPAVTPYVHDNAADAEAEAQRLARVHGGTYAVFKAIKAYERGEIPVNEVAA